MSGAELELWAAVFAVPDLSHIGGKGVLETLPKSWQLCSEGCTIPASQLRMAQHHHMAAAEMSRAVSIATFPMEHLPWATPGAKSHTCTII
jgi:hypothetical protein